MPSKQVPPLRQSLKSRRGQITLLPYLGSSHNKDGIIPNFKGDDAYETGLSHPGIAAWDRAPHLWLFFSLGMINYAGTIMRLTYQMRIAHEKRPILNLLATLNPLWIKSYSFGIR